jgi:hypothetical protein
MPSRFLKNEYIWMVISEGWCGDGAQLILFDKMVAESDGKIDMKIVLRDENEELMNLFLTKAKSIQNLLLLIKKPVVL